ncbi:putative ABC-type dipeptide/oligopeptide/nickel transport systems, permease component [Vibrio nigripulchritudo SOn1]|uniref:ABC-type dipeptide/oligopeptide/nickel transport systems, permease component n=1 Tax=Vibrio nigripulchritudo SOn1 TaxID=1238450 RepID=A0AAV2VYA2_9VIBR|nr:ABC transporter permease [Vibrio nigripulchritudo]CCO49473.1 putative ABC-type dipeptide/oligopeptide/nickel transport systems, permease component [Vibrio nigripulchritudo SOn1]
MWKSLLSRPSVCISVMIIVVIVSLALGASIFAPYDPTEQFFEGLTLEGAPLPPNDVFWLGTDLLGRDLLSRIIYGSQTSLLIGVVANGVAILIGTTVGVIAAYFKGWIGTALMRFTDLMMAFPALLLAIALAAIFTPSLWIVAMVIAMVNWVQIARVVYSETLAISEKDFIAAEKAIGVPEWKILLSHIFPHLVPTMLVWGTLGISTTVLLEATLSYLGIGVQPPIPSWGNIIFENQTYFSVAPWLVFIPGNVIILLSLCFNILGDALRDALDPTLNGREAG